MLGTGAGLRRDSARTAAAAVAVALAERRHERGAEAIVFPRMKDVLLGY